MDIPVQSLATNGAFVAYAASIVVLTLNLAVVWTMSAVVRGKSRTTPNEEDAKAGRSRVEPQDPPEVARVLRAHANAMANIVPFAILGLVYVLAGGSAQVALIVFGVFTAVRIAHSVAYLAGKQPWRTIFFVSGLVTTVVLTGFVVKALIPA